MDGAEAAGAGMDNTASEPAAPSQAEPTSQAGVDGDNTSSEPAAPSQAGMDNDAANTGALAAFDQPTDRAAERLDDASARAAILADFSELFGSSSDPSVAYPYTARVSGGSIRAKSLELADLDPSAERGRGPAGAKLRYEWLFEVEPPRHSLYGGQHYRIALRYPRGYPLHAPRLQALSILLHSEVELRDPYEGQFDETFYDALIARVHHTSGGAGAPPSGGAVSDCAISAEAPAATGLLRQGGLRFGVGDRVQCNVGVWREGTVVALTHSEPGWEGGRSVTY